MLRLRQLLAVLLLATGLNAQSPCDWFDHYGDGLISGAHPMSGFSQKGTEHLSSSPMVTDQGALAHRFDGFTSIHHDFAGVGRLHRQLSIH